MAESKVPTLVKNLTNFIPALSTFGTNGMAAFNTWKKICERREKYAPEHYRMKYETFDQQVGFRKLWNQYTNMWVDKELSTEVSQKELSQLINTKMDLWKIMHTGVLPLLLGGGYGLPFVVWFLSNDALTPSTFNVNPEQMREWRKTQDEWRFKLMPSSIADFKHHLDHATTTPAELAEGWDHFYDKNHIAKDPKLIGPIGMWVECIWPFWRPRRKQMHRTITAMGIPVWPAMMFKINAQTRFKDYWELIWNEDYMVIRDKMHLTMSDEELETYAWNRFLAPTEYNLSREEITDRVERYHELLGTCTAENFKRIFPHHLKDGEIPDHLHFTTGTLMEDGICPNIFLVTAYCMSHYNEPAYLEGDIAELEQDDFPTINKYAKDAFVRRLLFENGPFRDQIEAYGEKKIKQREETIARIAAARTAAAKGEPQQSQKQEELQQ